MADTKISAMTDVVTLAAGDKVPVADISDLSISKYATITEINAAIRAIGPTIPTAGGTNLQHVKTDGTNLILTTETYATPASPGQVLVADNVPNWVLRTVPGDATF